MGIYVYAIGRSGEGEAPPLKGVFDEPVYRIEAGSLSAAVSRCPVAVVRAERRHLAATHATLAALSARSDALPLAFGAVVASENELRRFLDDHREALEAQLRRISGTVEMSLRLTLEAADPVAYLVARTPALRAARERVFHGRRPPSRDDKFARARCSTRLCATIARRTRRASSAICEPRALKSSPCRRAASAKSPTSRRWCRVARSTNSRQRRTPLRPASTKRSPSPSAVRGRRNDFVRFDPRVQ